MTVQKMKSLCRLFLLVLVITILSSCGNQAPPTKNPTVTPTPTEVIQVVPPTDAPVPSVCEGLAGELEVQVLVGPADVVGLEPVAVGSIPFAVTNDEEPYLIQGSGNIDYADILVEEWGTYEVTMAMDGGVDGECNSDEDGGLLALELELTGEQLVVVTSDGFSGEYPWAGTQSLQLRMPIEEGSSAEGEGWVIVLHLN